MQKAIMHVRSASHKNGSDQMVTMGLPRKNWWVHKSTWPEEVINTTHRETPHCCRLNMPPTWLVFEDCQKVKLSKSWLVRLGVTRTVQYQYMHVSGMACMDEQSMMPIACCVIWSHVRLEAFGKAEQQPCCTAEM